MRQSRRHIICLLAAAFLMSLLPACTSDAPLSPSEPEYTDGPDVWLTLKLNTNPLSNTRAAENTITDAQGHPEEAGTAAENYIDRTDMTIILMNSDTIAVKAIKGNDYGEVFGFENNSDNSNWDLLFRITKKEKELLGTNKPIYILLVANNKGTAGGGQDLGNDIYMKSFDEICELRKTYKISVASWVPLGEPGSCIPMSGLGKFELPEDIDNYNNLYNSYSLGSINMMRSMCKIRVVDKISSNNSNMNNFAIKSVNVYEPIHTGFILPNVNMMYEWAHAGETCIGEVASRFQDNRNDQNRGDGLYYSTRKIFNKKTNSTEFIIYLPEMDFSGKNYPERMVKPKLQITTVQKIEITDDEGNKTVSEIEKEWNEDLVKLLNPENKSANNNQYFPYNQMVRNHIYEFDVDMVEPEGDLLISYKVCPWEKDTVNITFN